MKRRLAAWLLALAAQPVPAADAALGLPALKSPPAEQVALGRRLFFDRRLSANGTLSCAMCHVPEQGFTVNETRTSVGMHGVSLRRNAPTLLNVAYVERLFHDGRAASLEEQALQPLVHPDEMANASLASVIARVNALSDYRAPLRAAFGSARASPQRLARALAAYQRTLIAAGSPFDRWYYGGDAEAMDGLAQRGFAVFRARGCVDCHAIGARHALFSDGGFHNIGVRARSESLNERPVDVVLVPGTTTQVTPETLRIIGVADAPDRGRHEVTGRAADLRAFRTPSLRNVALTAPYMHDGSLATLDEVLDHYVRGGWPADPAQDPRIRPIVLDAQERRALLAFLAALTSPAALPSSRLETGR
ncbi:cytochrome c peroxidase [uncultured Piscinibacter sp.]|uniref:cytochrome-c peroxidase n=1 Tax=uncultured Piscinibacter sp. TaxID=1131835 RepID=UPI00261D5217|nr:cytochrome c peroxidase [uncultured Piscinibacter sp.]